MKKKLVKETLERDIKWFITDDNIERIINYLQDKLKEYTDKGYTQIQVVDDYCYEYSTISLTGMRKRNR